MSDLNTPNDEGDKTVGFTTDIVAAFVGNANNTMDAPAIASLITSVHSALLGLSNGQSATADAPVEKAVPFTSAGRSIHNDYLICLEDGRKMKTLKRYIGRKYGLTPDAYRKKFNLKPDYPMTAPGYSAMRADLAKKIGLGRKRTAADASDAPKAARKPAAKKATKKAESAVAA